MVTCHNSPQHGALEDPYPSGAVKITDFRYDSALILVRLKDAPARRGGKDADYLVGRPYLCAWQDQVGEWHKITVPAGMITDLTSVPWILQSVVGRVGPWLEASIVHDFLYLAWQDVAGKEAEDIDRRFADDLMKIAMKTAKVSAWRRTLIFTVVRLFGKMTYYQTDEDRYVDLHDHAVTGQVCEGGLHLPEPDGGLPLS
jgi:hypothetical protein